MRPGSSSGGATWALFVCLAAMYGGAAAQPVVDVAELEAAAQRGEVPALVSLAEIYERGEHVERDFLKSNAYYCKAAARGDSDALLRLGTLYAAGREVPRDQGVGALLVSMAAERGNERARELLPYIVLQHDSVLPACMNEPAVVEAAAVPFVPKVRKEIALLVQKLAPEYSIDPALVMALIAVESNFDTGAVSPKNAQGLMQLIPATAARFGVKNVLNPVDNLKGGLAYLQWLMAYFRGDVALVLAAYNAGEEAVERYRGIPPYRETRNYVKKIKRVYRQPSHPYLAEVVAPSSVIIRTR